MKAKLIVLLMGLSFLGVSLLVINSCSKFAQDSLLTQQKDRADKNIDTDVIVKKDFRVSNEELKKVYYKCFTKISILK